MKITARAALRHTGHTHKLKEAALLPSGFKPQEDGTLIINTRISVRDGMTGNYWLTIELDQSEALLIGQRALTAPLDAKIVALTRQLKDLEK